MNMKFVISGILIACVGLVFSCAIYIAYEFLGLFHVQDTFDVYDIIAIIVSSLLFYRICLLLGVSSGR